MQKITPFLLFDSNAEEAMNFYTSIFKDSKILTTNYDAAGKLFTGTLKLQNQELMVLNGGPYFKFTEAISLFVNCDTQAEVDELWLKLSDQGSEGRCGWLKDRFGLSWQIIPKVLGELLGDPDPVKAQRVMAAMLKMSKIDTELLLKARDGK